MGKLEVKYIYLYSLKGSSIIEVTVAMVLAGITFGLATAIYFNVVTSSLSSQKLKLSIELKHMAIETRKNETYFDSEIEYGDNVIILKRIEAWNDKPQLLVLHLKALNNDQRVLAEYKELVYVLEKQ